MPTVTIPDGVPYLVVTASPNGGVEIQASVPDFSTAFSMAMDCAKGFVLQAHGGGAPGEPKPSLEEKPVIAGPGSAALADLRNPPNTKGRARP